MHILGKASLACELRIIKDHLNEAIYIEKIDDNKIFYKDDFVKTRLTLVEFKSLVENDSEFESKNQQAAEELIQKAFRHIVLEQDTSEDSDSQSKEELLTKINDFSLSFFKREDVAHMEEKINKIIEHLEVLESINCQIDSQLAHFDQKAAQKKAAFRKSQ